MKKNTLIITLLLLVSVLIFCSCSKSPGAYEDVKPSDNIGQSGAELDGDIYSGDRKIIVKTEYNIETTDFDGTLDKLQAAVDASGGYTESSRIYSNSDKSAELVFRIPNDKVAQFTKTVEGAGNITYQTRTGQDVTLQYTDISARLEALKAERDRVTVLMNEAGTVSETMEISRRLAEIEQEYNSLQSQLNTLSNSTEFATFSISLVSVDTYSDTAVYTTFWEKAGKAFVDSFKFFGNVCQTLFIGFIYLLPLIVVIAAITVVIVIIVKAKKNKKSK